MSTSPSEQNADIVHREVLRSLQRLTYYINQLTDPDLIDHCRIWKHEKGAKKLIELAIQSDRFISQQAKALRAYHENAQKASQAHLNLTQHLVHQMRATKVEQEREETPSNHDIKMEQQEPQIYQSSQSHDDTEVKPIKQEEIVKIENNCEANVSFEQSEGSSRVGGKKLEMLQKRYLRGPYKNYSRQVKSKLVQLYKSGQLSISKISSVYGVPIKNIKRWAENGIDRKQGAGRKRLDPSMENSLFQLIKQSFTRGSTLKLNQIRCLALNLSRVEDFKASKGWILSFIDRFDLARMYEIIP